MEIIFVRHAEKDVESKEGSLSKKGVIQANNLAKKLSKDKFDEFYCSDKNRAKETSLIVARRIGIKPTIEQVLNEFEVEIFKKEFKDWDNDSKIRFKSLKNFLDSLTKRANTKKRVLIIAHGYTNRLVLGILLEISLKNLIRFQQSETAINEVCWNEYFKNWRLRTWNNDGHIPIKFKNKQIIDTYV